MSAILLSVVLFGQAPPAPVGVDTSAAIRQTAVGGGLWTTWVNGLNRNGQQNAAFCNVGAAGCSVNSARVGAAGCNVNAVGSSNGCNVGSNGCSTNGCSTGRRRLRRR